MKDNGRALQYASEEMRNRRNIVLAAVEKDGTRALQYASDELKDDVDIMDAASEQDSRALQLDQYLDW